MCVVHCMNNFFSMQRDCFCCALSFKIHSKGINKHILLMNETDTEHWNRNIENKTGGGNETQISRKEKIQTPASNCAVLNPAERHG